MARTNQYRNWSFTINNPSEDDDPKHWPKPVYCVWQLERGQEGTLHYQGFVKFANTVTLTWLKERCNERAHWEVARNVTALIAYCQKEETREDGPWEIGKKPPGQGHRSDMNEVKEKLDQGLPMGEIAEEHFALFCQYRRSFVEYRQLKLMPRYQAPRTAVYWGPSGVGKSLRAMWEAPDAYMKMKPTTADFWDGYDGQEAVIINDFYGWIQHCELLRLLDWYPHQVKVTGGYVKFNAKLIIFTSNVHPKKWYNDEKLPYDGGPLERRLMEFGVVEGMMMSWTPEFHCPHFIGPKRLTPQ